MTRPTEQDAEAALAEGSREVDTLRVRSGQAAPAPDRVAREEPLEIQVGGESIAVVMRTPGHDLELVAGFLRTEGILGVDETPSSIHHASTGDQGENLVRVTLRDDTSFDPERLRRNLFASSSCGVCGKPSREAALQTAPPLDDPSRYEPAFFIGLPERLRADQTVFGVTGGLHAAALLAPDGRVLVVREDVGRHNAVDKVVGWASRELDAPLTGHVILVSGRVSFEIAQKALAARVPAVAAVSAPSSLAIELARDAGLLVVAFLRGKDFNAYGATERLHR